MSFFTWIFGRKKGPEPKYAPSNEQSIHEVENDHILLKFKQEIEDREYDHRVECEVDRLFWEWLEAPVIIVNDRKCRNVGIQFTNPSKCFYKIYYAPSARHLNTHFYKSVYDLLRKKKEAYQRENPELLPDFYTVIFEGIEKLPENTAKE